MVLYMVLDPDPVGYGTVSKPTRITTVTSNKGRSGKLSKVFDRFPDE